MGCHWQKPAVVVQRACAESLESLDQVVDVLSSGILHSWHGRNLACQTVPEFVTVALNWMSIRMIHANLDVASGNSVAAR